MLQRETPAGKVFTALYSFKGKPLRPEDLLEQFRAAYDFKTQELRKTKRERILYILRTCLNCGQQEQVKVSNVRRSAKKGELTGKCKPCSIPRGVNHPAWNGGRCMTTKGYVVVRVPDHPHATNRGYVLEHRLVMEEKLGRYLSSAESVHHINGIKDDNWPDNLELWTGAGAQPYGIRVEDAPHCPTCACNVTY